jgi:transposase
MWQVGIEVRKDITATALRKKARAEKNGRVAARMLGVANILDGMDRATAARTAGMDWVHRYNEEGLGGLCDRPKGRPERALTPQQEKEVEMMVLAEPEGVLVRWRRKDIKAEIEKRYDVVLSEVSVGRMLRRLGFCRMSARPLHPKNDPEAVEAFKKTSPPAWRKSCPNAPKEKPSSFGSRTKQGSDKRAR